MGVLRTSSLVAALGLAILGNGCDEPTAPAPGEIVVDVDEEGIDVPQVGYVSAVDNGPPRTLNSPQLRAIFANIELGAHTVRLEGLAPNCAVVGQNPMTVHVASSQTTIAQFIVSCVAHIGTVRVTTVTTGADPDPSGYLAMIDGVARGSVGANTTLAISDVRPGRYPIWLDDVAPNCTVAPPTAVDVDVAFQGTAEVLFTVQCEQSGTLEVTIRTTGDDVDPDGYRVDVQGGSAGFAGSLRVTPNGSVTFASLLPAADYHVALQDMTENCAVMTVDSPTVTVTAGSTTTVALEVACSPLPRLAFERYGDIYTIASNGAALRRLTTDPAHDSDPAWSSTGRIAFTTQWQDDNVELYVMNDDGTNPVRLTTSAGADDAPSWSPDGGKIVFRSARDVNFEIYVVNADGTGLTRLTNNPATDQQPAWSSTGKIAFVSTRDHSAGEIYVMKEDGSNVVRLTNNTIAESGPAWSPDGSTIAFARGADCFYYYYECGWDVFVMDADGSNERRLSTGTGSRRQATDPSWSANGRTIAFTQAFCGFYYCDPPSVWIIDLHVNRVAEVTEGANPAWKP